MIIELISLALTVETIFVDIGRSWLLWRGWVTLSVNFRWKGTLPTNLCWCQKTRLIVFLCGIKISAVCSFILSQSTCATDGQNYDCLDHTRIAASQGNKQWPISARCGYRTVNKIQHVLNWWQKLVPEKLDTRWHDTHRETDTIFLLSVTGTIFLDISRVHKISLPSELICDSQPLTVFQTLICVDIT